MEKLSLAEVARFCGAKSFPDGVITKISTDSRDVDENTLFIALKGERFDAHDFVPEVIKNGAKAVICDKTVGDDKRIMYVENTGKALLDIAAGYRKQFHIPFIALTGSVGKTTTKGMVFAVVNKKFNALKTEGNLNNEIGVPKTIFSLTKEHEAAVIEMGMNHFGEIASLTAVVLPDIGIITNIGTAHIENLGSREGILKAKCEILNGMKKGSPLIVNGDNDMLASYNNDNYKILRFGIDGKNLYIKAESIVQKTDGTFFTVVYKDDKENVFVPAVGLHNVYNALAAMCVGLELGFTLKEAAEAVGDFVPEGMRQKITKIHGYTFIEDCYNANLDSMKAALSTLNTIKQSRSIAVLGDMLELGDYSEKAHRETGVAATLLGTDIVLTYGENAAFTAEEAKKKGIKEARSFFDKKELTAYLKSILAQGDTVLFKGSRGMKMEDVFNSLYKEWDV